MAIHPAGRLWLWTLYSRTLLYRGLQCPGDTHMLKHTGILPKILGALTSMGSISVKKKQKKKTKQKQKNPYRTVPFLDEIYTSQVQIHKNWEKLVKSGGGGGYTNYFLMECVWPEVWNPNPYLRIFLTQKTKQNETKQKQKTKQTKKGIDSFLEIFANWDPFVIVFLPQKRLTLQFFAIFVTGPSSKDFFDQNETHV